MNERALRARLATAGQEFLADHLETLGGLQRESLLAQIEALDLELLASLRAGEGLAGPPQGGLAQMDYVPFSERGPSTAAAAAGREALGQGKVAFALLAGGQASRLRLDGPKGAFPIGPASERSLFQVLAEHILRAGGPPLALTTSASTDAAVRAFFEQHDCFGLDRTRLSFACQGSLPALDEQGRLLLAAPDKLFKNPDGHGGAVTALATEGMLDDWADRGVEVVCTFQVDNPLLKVVDPDFIGRLLLGRAPIATKIVLKQDPAERVGLVARLGGRPAIVEYSEIGTEQAAARDADGRLSWRLGSIAVHAFRLDFLQAELSRPLPLHVARREVPCVTPGGEEQRRTATKYERFLFDLFPRAQDVTVVEVLREREYAPLKNAVGNDSAKVVRAALETEYRRWYAEAGKQAPDGPLELSPLDAVGPKDLA